MMTLIDTLTLKRQREVDQKCLSYNHRKLAQNNAVVNQNDKNGLGGGFEPTTSAYASILVQSFVNGKKHVQIPPAPLIRPKNKT